MLQVTNYKNKFFHRKLLKNKVFWAILNIVLLYPILVRGGSGDPPKTNCNKVTTVGESLQNPICASSFSELVKGVAGAAMKIGIPIAAIFIIYSGLKFVTARGNEAKLSEAKDMFMYTMIGTAILLGAWVIATAIQNTIMAIGG